MNRRLFIKSLSLLIGLLTFRLFSEQVKELLFFNHGVASGDPTNSHVILWTKLTKKKKNETKVLWEVSLNENFESTINSGIFFAKPEDDFTVKVDAKIPSKFNGKKIYYRFISEGIFSDIGITSTLPTENPQNFNIAFCSCSNYPAGYFNAYKEIANNEKIHLTTVSFDRLGLSLNEFFPESAPNFLVPKEVFPLLIIYDFQSIDRLDQTNKNNYKAEAHLKLATPLTPIALTLIALTTFLLTGYRRKGFALPIYFGILVGLTMQAGTLSLRSVVAENNALFWLLYFPPIFFIVLAICLILISQNFNRRDKVS